MHSLMAIGMATGAVADATTNQAQAAHDAHRMVGEAMLRLQIMMGRDKPPAARRKIAARPTS